MPCPIPLFSSKIDAETKHDKTNIDKPDRRQTVRRYPSRCRLRQSTKHGMSSPHANRLKVARQLVDIGRLRLRAELSSVVCARFGYFGCSRCKQARFMTPLYQCSQHDDFRSTEINEIPRTSTLFLYRVPPIVHFYTYIHYVVIVPEPGEHRPSCRRC